MYSKPVIAQEWSLHAQLTISQRPNGDIIVVPSSTTENNGRVNMEYSWSNQSNPTSTTTTVASRPCYGFQRGNILFTTTPPPRKAQSQQSTSGPSNIQQHNLLNPKDSGYTSEQVSPTSGSYNSLPTRRNSQSYNRRCKSTCSITLSGVHPEQVSCKVDGTIVDDGHPVSTRCGDPVCYHADSNILSDTNSSELKVNSLWATPVPEGCEVCGGGRSPTSARRAAKTNTVTTHFCTRVPEKTPGTAEEISKLSKDVAIQTADLPSSAIIQPNSTSRAARNLAYARSKTDSQLLRLPTYDFSKEATEKQPGKKRLSRSPARAQGKSPLLQGRKSQGSQCSDIGNKHKPRTVHIDVYCTGSEDADASDSSSSTDSVEEESMSSPQTVYESEKVRVTHTQAGKHQLPQQYLDKQQKRSTDTPFTRKKSQSLKAESTSDKVSCDSRAYDSDDGLSSQYPSQRSSISTINDSISLVSDTTRNPSSSTISSTSCTAFTEDGNSVITTSWKDTTTDLDSFLPSGESLACSDSFEYADSIDRLRIKEKESAWAWQDEESRSWKSPQVERKHLLQQQKLKEFMDRHVGEAAFPLWRAEPSEDTEDDDDETGDAWSFGGSSSSKGCSLRRESTVRKANTDQQSEIEKILPRIETSVASPTFKEKDNEYPVVNEKTINPNLLYTDMDTGSVSDSGHRHHRIVRQTIGPFGVKSPSPPLDKLQSSITSPFTLFGKRTDHSQKAEKFGTIVGAFRKPGHHIGPSKNPDCPCEHCRRFYEEHSSRNRTRSVGDVPLNIPLIHCGTSKFCTTSNASNASGDFDTQSEASSIDFCDITKK